MDINEDQERLLKEHLQDDDQESHQLLLPSSRKKGGFITMPFILANEAFERVASYGLTPNMIVYLMDVYKMSVTNAQNLIYFWNSTNSFTPFIGAILADSYLGRFLTIGCGSIFSLLGMFVFWMTTIIPQAKPPACEASAQNCKSTTTGQYAFLIFSFVLMSIGTGGIRASSQAFGVDQLERGDHSYKKKQNSLEVFLNWYNVFSALSVLLALTVIVYIQEQLGWIIGFGVPVILMFFATLSFFLAAPFYVIVKGNKNLLSGLAQVIVAAFKNRNINLTDLGSSVQYYQGKDSVASAPSDRLRFLNKACIIQDPDKDIGTDGLARDPWRLCRIEDVEGLKALIRIIPIWSTGIMVSVNQNLGSFSLLLLRTMDRHIGPKFEIPSASFGTSFILVLVIWISVYDRVILPLASKIHGKPVSLSVKLRMGIGLFFSAVAVLLSGIVESIRRERAISEGFEDDPEAVIEMSALWATIPSIFGGIAEAFFGVGQIEFFLSELPKDMLSVAASIFTVSSAIGAILASVLFNLTDSITKRGGHEGWFASNVNKGHYHYYYYLVASINLLNLVYYIYCSRAYGPTVGQEKKVDYAEGSDEPIAMSRDTQKIDKEG